ncbi:MAG TPA: DNA polymerase III subunit delta [Gemmatimonadaceae bacterium]|nr:DNA polymerase III subunit delta [Gemmatimonadaceae bacterium]
MSPPPAADAKVLRTAAKERSFDPAYYFYGDDDYLKNEELRRLIDAAIEPATRDFNLEFLRGSEVDATTLGSIASTPPMMAERRAVVVREVNALKKDARAILDAYLDRPAPDALVVLVAPAGVKPDKALLSTTTGIEFAPLSGARIPRWISYYVEHDLHASITSGAVTLLQEAVGTELAQLRVELDKLAAFTGGATIDEIAVSAVVGIRPGETLGDFLDAVARRDAVAAVGMLDTVMQQPKASAVTTVMALAAQTFAIAWAQAARERGSHAGKLTQDLFSLLKESGSVFTGRSWGEFVSTCVREAERWSPAAIDAALDALLEADKTLKDSRVSSDEQVLATLVLLLCSARPGRRAA